MNMMQDIKQMSYGNRICVIVQCQCLFVKGVPDLMKGLLLSWLCTVLPDFRIEMADGF